MQNSTHKVNLCCQSVQQRSQVFTNFCQQRIGGVETTWPSQLGNFDWYSWIWTWNYSIDGFVWFISWSCSSQPKKWSCQRNNGLVFWERYDSMVYSTTWWFGISSLKTYCPQRFEGKILPMSNQSPFIECKYFGLFYWCWQSSKCSSCRLWCI